MSQYFTMESINMMLGKALAQPQLYTMMSSCTFWFAVQSISRNFSGVVFPVYNRLSKEERYNWNVTIAALIHAIVSCTLASRVVLNPDESLNEDPIYGESPRAQLANAVSAGYFLWDFAVVMSAKKFDIGFLVHAVACFFCYLFGQYPFLNYVGCWFLLFELSTPFLNIRHLLGMAGYKNSKVYNFCQTAFGIVFIVVRLLFGIPISLMFWKDMYKLLAAGKQHSTIVVLYYLVANIALNALNVLWGSSLFKRAFGMKKKRAA